MVGGATSGQMALGSLSKAEQAMRGKPEAPLHGLCISSCLQVPVEFEFLP